MLQGNTLPESGCKITAFLRTSQIISRIFYKNLRKLCFLDINQAKRRKFFPQIAQITQIFLRNKGTKERNKTYGTDVHKFLTTEIRQSAKFQVQKVQEKRNETFITCFSAWKNNGFGTLEHSSSSP